MAVVELDPLFIKAHRLLHSKAKDSGAQLKKLLDDVIVERKKQRASSGESKQSSSKLSSKPEIERQKSHKSDYDRDKKKEAEKRSIEKVKKEPRDPDEDLIPEKKARHVSPQPVSKPKKDLLQPDSLPKPKKDSPQSGRSPSHDVRVKEEAKDEKPKSEKKKDDDMDADEFAFGLGISCVVCKSFDVTSRNQLVECQECHSLYHQECHKPPVTEQDVNDPRFVWYCCRCSKNMKKMVQSKTTKSRPPSTTSVKDSTAPSNKSSKSDPTSLFSFRRVDPKVSSSKDPTNNSGAKPLSGLASLAANLSGKSEQSKSHGQSGKIDQSKSSQSGKSDQSKSFSQSGKSDPSKSSSQTKNIFSKFDQMEKVSLLSGTKFSGKPESSKPTSTPKLDFMKTLSSKLSPDTIKANMKPPTPKSAEPNKPIMSKPISAPPAKPHQSQGGASAVVNAEKKLQMMKKKAAAKLQEKRASLK